MRADHARAAHVTTCLARVTGAAIVLWLAVCPELRPGLLAAEVFTTQTADVAIRAIVESGAPFVTGPAPPADRTQLIALYSAGRYVPLWVGRSGQATHDAHAALVLLNDAAAEGLDPLDYDAVRLQGLADRLGRTELARVEDVAAFDVALSLNVLRYFRHLHFGRVEPAAVGFHVPPREREDLVEPLRAALGAHRIAALAGELAPSTALYRRLRIGLRAYRALEADPRLRLFQPPHVTVHPGEQWDGLPQLYRLLSAFGDLPAGDSDRMDSLIYDGELVEGVKRFQLRHGLEPDGVVGKSTIAALSVPLAWRVRQIELALERLRWLPDLGPDRFLAVNIPMFRAWGMEHAIGGHEPSFSTDVIVGRALNTQTPVLVEDMQYVIFRPYWNVPSSILRHEILPALNRAPDYLQRHRMEVVSGQSDEAPVVPMTAVTIERLRQGVLRIRQRPGPDNSLGLVKFVFPNDANVYLHGTPAPDLFSRNRRDFSHGCIRVADPIGLAEWVLAEQPDWARDRIVAAMHGNESIRVNLARPIRVILFYLTAVVTPSDDRVHFVEDIYGHDGRLDRYLTARGGS